MSLLQQHLQGDEADCFVDGSVKWGKVAREIRSRVKTRLRELYHIPETVNVSPQCVESLESLGHPIDPLCQIETMVLLLQREPTLYPAVQSIIPKVLVRSTTSWNIAWQY